MCGCGNRLGAVPIDRETASCASCGSNVRTRGLLYALSMELFGTGLILRDFPRIGSVRGLGISDSNDYAALLRDSGTMARWDPIEGR